jgi:hypothetical protein
MRIAGPSHLPRTLLKIRRKARRTIIDLPLALRNSSGTDEQQKMPHSPGAGKCRLERPCGSGLFNPA